jgi:hypothetical protein
MFKLFGYKIGKEEDVPSIQSFAPPFNEDGAFAVNEGGVYGTAVELGDNSKNEMLLITKYREMAAQPECERAIDDIINEAIVYDKLSSSVSLVLDGAEDLSASVKGRILDEFDEILSLLNFSRKGYNIFRNWYVDGRLYYHKMIDTKNIKAGIQELRYIDPRKIKKIRVEKTDGPAINYVADVSPKKYYEYFVYSPKGILEGQQGLKIAKDSITYVTSGVQDETNNMVLSHLHKAIKPLNQLRTLEDATVIYRLARAPERRVFYIDVGNLPKAKAEQYLRDTMAKHKNKLVYDAVTGDVKTDRKFLTMLEDYFLPRREGSRGTEITTLAPGQNLGEITDVEYFRNKLYESLNVPVTRLQSDGQFNLGRSSEITRDELKFANFISRLRVNFSALFVDLLKTQLLLKGVLTKAEWDELESQLFFDFKENNQFSELKDLEILRERLSVLGEIDSYTNKYFSKDWVRKNILKQTEEEIEEIDAEIEASKDEDDDFDDDDEDVEETPKPKPKPFEDKKKELINTKNSEKEEESDE